MTFFRTLNPFTQIIVFAAVISVSIFTLSPLYLLAGFFGALSFSLILNGFAGTVKSALAYILLIAPVAVTNPLFSHNGRTVLFFINDLRITLEAFLYGAMLGLAVAVAGSRFRRYIRSFSAVLTLSMERAIITSDSMRARGYGKGRRTHYSRFAFTVRDFIITISVILFLLLSVFGKANPEFYPSFIMPEPDLGSVVSVISYWTICMFPAVYEGVERWKLSASRI